MSQRLRRIKDRTFQEPGISPNAGVAPIALASFVGWYDRIVDYLLDRDVVGDSGISKFPLCACTVAAAVQSELNCAVRLNQIVGPLQF